MAAISRFRVDLSQCKVELQKVSEERDALRLLCSQNDEAIKDLQADLAKARKEEAELDKQVSLVLLKYGFDSTVEVSPSLSQLQQKVEKIELLREEVDQIKAECNRWKETIDRLAAEKETILTKLLSADVQLRNVKQKCSDQAKRIEKLEARLAEAKAEESKNIVTLRLDELIGNLTAFELRRKTMKMDVPKKERSLTLKIIEGFDLKEDEMDMITKDFKKYLMRGKCSSRSGGYNKPRDTKKQTNEGCYKCGKIDHHIKNFPQWEIEWKKERAK
ncbi:uncharacterized protein [Nicotiana tomentosiformis]|uniref:uncharacterized protein n=1 Tax=Nicotiana tomentosiformis TaxID=4098 RepID=UPI00388C9CC4